MKMSVDENSIRELAYRLWEERGKPEGRPDEDWCAAECQLSGAKKAESKSVDEAEKQSFPASDPPANSLPDKPPANADEKWAAAKAARSTKKPRKTAATAETSEKGSVTRYVARNSAGEDTGP
jgi:hypothetical protein